MWSYKSFVKHDAFTHQGSSVRGGFYGREGRYGVFTMLSEGGGIRSKVGKKYELGTSDVARAI